MKKARNSALFLWILIPFTLFAVQETPSETEGRVVELANFHDVIYPIWHTAYPQKDYAALRQFAPEVKNLAEKIYVAQLPGILRDKLEKWRQGLEEFRKAVDSYLAAAAAQDDEALLNAAEELHAKYEMMVRIIRPVLKEVDAFHKILYVVYHKNLPDKDYDKIRVASEEMRIKAEAITQAALPQRLEDKKEPFLQAARELLASTVALIEAGKSGESKLIEEAVEKVHTAYQKLEKIFD